MNLLELQRKFGEALLTPLRPDETIAQRTRTGRAMQDAAGEIIKPNDRLSSVERLEIYSRSYWFRILSSFNEDFVGLRAVVGERKFDALAEAYLADNPSRSFTLRNLGSRLEAWLRANPKWVQPNEQLALDMVRLEWADIECFDAAEQPALTAQDVVRLDADPQLRLQPHMKLLDLQYPVDNLLLAFRDNEADDSDEASNTFSERRRRSRAKSVQKTKPKPTFVVVHRVDFDVYFKRVTPEAFRLLLAFQDGKTLSEAIETAFPPSTLPENQILETTHGWFQDWAQWGWFSAPAS